MGINCNCCAGDLNRTTSANEISFFKKPFRHVSRRRKQPVRDYSYMMSENPLSNTQCVQSANWRYNMAEEPNETIEHLNISDLEISE